MQSSNERALMLMALKTKPKHWFCVKKDGNVSKRRCFYCDCKLLRGFRYSRFYDFWYKRVKYGFDAE